MGEFDLSAHRSQRTREDKTLIMKGDEGQILAKYRLVPEWPVEAFDYGVEGKLGAAFQTIFQDSREAQEFMSTFKPSIDDLSAVMKGVYGLGELGEALASGS